MTAIKTGQPEKISDIINRVKKGKMTPAQKKRVGKRDAVYKAAQAARQAGYKVAKHPKVKTVPHKTKGSRQRKQTEVIEVEAPPQPGSSSPTVVSVAIKPVQTALELAGVVAKKPGVRDLETSLKEPILPTKPPQEVITLKEFMDEENEARRENWLELITLGAEPLNIYIEHPHTPSPAQVEAWCVEDENFRVAYEKAREYSAEVINANRVNMMATLEQDILRDKGPELGLQPDKALLDARLARVKFLREQMSHRHPARYPPEDKSTKIVNIGQFGQGQPTPPALTDPPPADLDDLHTTD